MVTAIALVVIAIWGGFSAFLITALLVVLEITLSFDNAVVNAKVLAQLSEKWQRRFLTWGIFFSVVVTRALLPIIIVAVSTGASIILIGETAIYDPVRYGQLLQGAHVIIASFGGIFLTLVGLRYFLDQEKEVHWIKFIERRLAQWGAIESVEIAFGLFVLFVIALFMPNERAAVLFSGLAGVLVFVLLQGIISAFNAESLKIHRTGFALFAYLNILDMAFSLDGVVGAFALTSLIPVIIVGLGAGAYFVRSLTLYMVRNQVLDELIYIEHGAHWAILGLAGAMLGSMFIHLPDPLTGLIGLTLVTFAYISSVKIQKQ
jgi:hypothetical protein